MEEFCKIENLTFRYFKDSKRNVLENVSLSFRKGEVAVLLGNSGCGKSTLAALLCGLYPENGGYLLSGTVSVEGRDLSGIDFRERARYMVEMFQNPDLQFCMKNLREELIFCLENIGTPRERMDEVIRDTLKRYGMQELAERPFSMLSGGEKQRAALCCLLMLNPQIMVLDEPFANLDDVSAGAYLRLLKQKTQEHRTTVIAIDHKASNWLDIADRFILLGEQGTVVHAGMSPRELRENRDLLIRMGLNDPFADPVIRQKPAASGEEAVCLRDACIFHKKQAEPILKDVSLTAGKGEVVACLGASGNGKTSLFLSLLKQKKYTGSIRIAGKELRQMKESELFSRIGIVFQNPANQFITTSVHEEVKIGIRDRREWPEEQLSQRVDDLLESYGLRHFRRFSPFMLSQGQQRRLGVLTMLVGGQRILLLDEPTYGQDGRTTRAIMDQVRAQAAQGITVIFSTHDQELAREYADRFWRVEGGTAYEED